MKKRDKSARAQPDSGADAPPREVTLLLCTADPGLSRAWSQTAAVPGFRLTTAPDLRTEYLAGGNLASLLQTHSPTVEGRKIEILRQSKVRRSKLNYLIGSAATVSPPLMTSS